MFRKYILPWLVLGLYRLFAVTWRTVVIESEELKDDLKNNKPIIFAHWHGDELAIVQLIPRYKLSTMTSSSKDGQLINFVIRKLGGKTSIGSSTRGAVGALKGLIRLCKSGHPSSMAVDGPTGPIYKVKKGVFELSLLTKARIYPAGVASNNSFHFPKSWNKIYLPKPFAKIIVCLEKPMPLVSKQDRDNFANLSKTLEKQLNDAKQKASKLIAKPKNEVIA